jgi:hypothetical protein
MKKLLVLCLIAAFAAPALADVTFVATDNADGTCTISYTYTDAKGPVGMGLVVDCSVGAVDDLSNIDSFFDVFIDFAYDEEQSGSYDPLGEGSATPNNAAADVAGPGVVAPSANFVISLAGLDPNSGSVPTGTVSLVTLSADENVEGIIDADTLRGGVVNKDGVMATNLPISFTITSECYAGQPDYAEWVAAGKPECWCYPRQCHGDANGTQEYVKPSWYYVYNQDLSVLIGSWKKATTDPAFNGCADFSRTAEYVKPSWYRVYNNDLTILITNWKSNPPADCLPGNKTP